MKINCKVVKYVVLFLMVAFRVQVDAQDTVKLRKRLLNTQFQYAGNLGLVSVGIGKFDLNKKLYSHIVYGYLPKGIGGTTVHTVGLKAAYRFATTSISPELDLNYYTGIAIFYSNTRNSYIFYPNYFQKGYYKSNSIHTSLFTGSRLDININHSKLRMMSFFTELGIVDHKLWNALLTKHIGLFDIWNISFGTAFAIKL